MDFCHFWIIFIAYPGEISSFRYFWRIFLFLANLLYFDKKNFFVKKFRLFCCRGIFVVVQVEFIFKIN